MTKKRTFKQRLGIVAERVQDRYYEWMDPWWTFWAEREMDHPWLEHRHWVYSVLLHALVIYLLYISFGS